MRPYEKVEVLRAACCVAGADGEIETRERELLVKLADSVGVGDASLEAMISRAATDCNFCEEQFRILKTDPKESMAILIQIALADNDFEQNEIETLRSFAERLGVPRDVFEKVVEKATANLSGPNSGS